MDRPLTDPLELTRRQFFSRTSTGIGTMALASLTNPSLFAGGIGGFPNFAPKAKRAIYLLQSGAPSQMDLFDYHESYEKLRGTELPNSIRGGQRLTGMTSRQKSFPIASPIFEFKQHGQSGAWVSDLMPHIAG
ncbi:MAG: DUF1501 domain-containing protein, partial [Planctomycetota bacterium]|nr:DUF1501 domain-containing protein [Planctomycetota bacterium]